MNPTSTPVRPASAPARVATPLEGHIVEIVGDADDGALRCGQSLAAIALRMGNGLWTTQIAAAGASGLRLRLGRQQVSNGGDQTDLVLAFNARVLLGRVQAGSLKPGAALLVESQAAQDPDPAVAAAFRQTVAKLRADGFEVHELPMLAHCRQLVSNPQKGMHMFVLGLLCQLYSLEATLARDQIARLFGKTDTQVINSNIALCEAGAAWAAAQLPLQFRISATPPIEPQIVVDGPTAIALGVMASGMDICTVAPNTLDAAAAQAFSEMFERIGGLVHPAEDDIAAGAFALGASYAGKCAVSLTSGAGYGLQQPLIDVAVKAEVPLVVIQLQGSGSGSGRPTADEPGGLLAAVFGSQGDAPKVVMAASGIEDAFYSVLTARKLAETFGMVVVLLCDAGLANAQQAIPRPTFSADWLAPPVDQTPVPAGVKPCDWDPVTGLARRLQPGRAGGMHTITGLAHGRDGQASRDPAVIEECRHARGLKLAALQQALKAPAVFGAPSGDMLLIGWGSSQGAIEEAVARLRAEGLAVSALHLRFIQPLAPGMRDILARFARVMTIEADGSAKPEDEMPGADQRRHSPLALMLRARFLRDIGCWSEARGTPIRPADICRVVRAALLKKDPAP